ncbi:MAG: membrane protein insertion efficiency factor YidD [Simkaniaceae bacterium]|nr:membrane protein insertion efficiency factor YidD [Simkaniaceae bacterium]
MKSISLLLLNFYQRIISPHLPKSCRFYPSCSEYSKQAITKYGTFKGVYKTARRLAKCHPWHPGGIDEP